MLDREDKKARFLVDFAISANVTVSARRVNVGRDTVYDWIEKDPAFAKSFENAREEGLDMLEEEVKRRAYEGNERTYWRKDGTPGNTVKEYSDTLAIFFLKGHRPEKYKEIRENQVKGAVEVIIKDMRKK